MILIMIFIYFYIFSNVHKVFYVLGGPRYKPPGVSRRSPRLHFIIMFMLMFVCCFIVTKIKFNSFNVSSVVGIRSRRNTAMWPIQQYRCQNPPGPQVRRCTPASPWGTMCPQVIHPRGTCPLPSNMSPTRLLSV